MGYSPDDVRIAVARRDAANGSVTTPVVEGWRDGVLTVWVPGAYKNPLNVSGMGVWKHRRWAKSWRERTAARLFSHLLGLGVAPWPLTPKTPKRITFQLYGWNPLDSDGRPAACKPLRDALKDMAVIDDDRDKSGHAFAYPPVIVSRKKGAVKGIAITVALLGGRA